MNLKKYKNLSDEKFKNLSEKEFEKYIKAVEDEFPTHYRKIDEITIETNLTPEEAIQIAKTFHKNTLNDPKKLNGTINEDTNQLFLTKHIPLK